MNDGVVAQYVPSSSMLVRFFKGPMSGLKPPTYEDSSTVAAE
jgi:hypothetical protein